MQLPEYDTMDAMEMAELVRNGELSPKDLREAAIERIQMRNPSLNAVVYKMYERAAQREAELPKGPLYGVPFLVKDLKLQIKDTPTSNSCLLTKDRMATQNSLLAERYEAAGLQILGKTNTPEFGLMGITESSLRGPCRNPWNTDHTPGGSSGGASSAVAARMVPIAHAGDGGGSIRIPASATGLFGLKPTRGRVSMAPFFGESWNGFVQEHALSKSVRDSAICLDIESQLTPGEPYAAPHKPLPYIEEIEKDPPKLKIAFTTENLLIGDPHPDCVAAVRDAVDLLETLGHEVVEAKPTLPKEQLIHDYFMVVAAGIARFVETSSDYAGVKPSPKNFEPSTWVMAQIGWAHRSSDLLAAQQRIQKESRHIASFFGEYDMFVTSTLARPPAQIGELLPTPTELRLLGALRVLPFKKLIDVALEKIATGKLAYTPNTQIFNQTGQPAMSVPLYWNDKNLPIGVQIAGGFGREDLLLQLAKQLETERPWANKLPPMISSGQT
ncbi:MAG: amidase [Myxococcota bacterium]|nr:amidase [Myxococcota bacterium]